MTEADDIMVRQMLERRRRQEDRRVSTGPSAGRVERRVLCTYCYQPGDHHTADDCWRALNRVDRA